MEQNEIIIKRGRKPGTDNKVPVTIYIEQSVLTRLGKGFLISGKDVARNVATNSIYEYDKKTENPEAKVA